ncbi:MAG: DUF4010 domain-containing protein [Myxococcota bacterium]
MHLPSIDPTLIRSFATAVFIGALVGVDRERRSTDQVVFGGLRTFVLIALAGACAAWLGATLGAPAALVGIGLVGLTALLAVAYVAAGAAGVGLTSEVAAIVVYLLGAACVAGQSSIAVVLGVTVSGLLAFKQPLHAWVRKLDQDDVGAALKLLFATFIVLPLLPDTPIDPWGAIVPYRVWWLVVLISGLSMLGYVAVRVVGERRGMLLTGLFGGLVSSTAVTMAAARRSVEPGASSAALAMSVLAAWAVMFVRVIVEVAVVNPAVVGAIAWPMGAMAVIAAIAAAWCGFRAPDGETGLALRNPFSLWEASKFAALYTAVRLAVELGRQYLDDDVLYGLAALAGTTDVDAITLSMADLAGKDLAVGAALGAIVIAAAVNTAVKFGMVVGFGAPSLARPIGWATVAIGVAGGVAAVASLW